MAADADNPESTAADDEAPTALWEDVDEAAEYPDEAGLAAAPQHPHAGVRLAVMLGIVLVVGLGAVCGWLGYGAYQVQQADKQREIFLQAARLGAVNLTTISYSEVEADVQRILDSSTGTFHDDFVKRSQPLIDVVKQAQSKSVGTISAAGLEAVQGDEARALVTVAVKSSSAAEAEQPKREWRMRIGVQKVGDVAKVSAVEFIP